MSTLTDKLPTVKLPDVKLPTVKLPDVKLPDFKAIDLQDAKKPAFAWVGVVDLYVEQVKELPAEAKKLQAKIGSARVDTTEKLKGVPAQIKGLPTQVKDLRSGLSGKVEKANVKYGELAVRGEKLISQIRRQPATEAAIAEGKAAVKKAEAAATSAKKTVKAAEKAVEDAVDKIG